MWSDVMPRHEKNHAKFGVHSTFFLYLTQVNFNSLFFPTSTISQGMRFENALIFLRVFRLHSFAVVVVIVDVVVANIIIVVVIVQFFGMRLIPLYTEKWLSRLNRFTNLCHLLHLLRRFSVVVSVVVIFSFCCTRKLRIQLWQWENHRCALNYLWIVAFRISIDE